MELIKNVIRQAAKLSDENGKIDYVDFCNELNKIEVMSTEDVKIIGTSIQIYMDGMEAAIKDPDLDPEVKLYEMLYTPMLKKAFDKFKEISVGKNYDFR